jgi:alcohol dehydrogenase, propanol-preferring
MKAFRLVQRGQPGQCCEVPRPVPKEGEILIQMKGAGLCHSDLDMLDSRPGSEPYAANIPPPYTLGPGAVEQLGDGVTDLRIGEGVAIRHLLHCSHCWYCLKTRSGNSDAGIRN